MKGKSKTDRPIRAKVIVFCSRALIGELLAQSLRSTSEVAACILVRSGDELPAAVRRIRPDVLILDPASATEDPFAIAEKAVRVQPGLKTVVVADFAAPGWVARALEIGASAFLGECAETGDIARAIRSAMTDSRFFTPCAARIVADFAVGGREFPRLDGREVELLRRISEGQTSKQIAMAIGASTKTVDSRRADLMLRTGAKSGPALVRFAFQNRYLSRP